MQLRSLNAPSPFRQARPAGWLPRLVARLLALFVCSLVPARAALQFDVFLGYDGAVREAAWFPVACEVYNDGPAFNAVFELTAGTMSPDQVRRVPLELPTNTRKRLIIPVFASGSYQWSARLLDERGKVRAVREGLQPKIVRWEGILVGAMPRTFAGVPVLPDPGPSRQDLKPQVARMQAEQFPDNPIALEGLTALYINSEKALSLRVNQIAALLAWIYEGGHLVVSVEQLADVNSTPWLQQLLPCELTDMASVAVDEDLLQWLRRSNGAPESNPQVRRPPDRPGRPDRPSRRTMPAPATPVDATLELDPNFYDAQVPVAVGRVREGEVLLSAKNNPLVVQGHRGRGQVTLLMFSPEREPVRSWKHRALFWSKVLDLPPQNMEYAAYGGWSLDGVFGALIDSRQIRKLPVEWLLLLLLVYLVVIGPFDQWWLKKINRQMLTWITFPSYVVLFSLLIYFIGYKLRAGETEWNELQVVDVLPHGRNAALRGRTFASIYSSANANYQLAFTPSSQEAADQSYACLRGELLNLNMGRSREASRTDVEQRGNVFRADIFVPVWTSLLYVNDWFQPGSPPIEASLTNHQDTLSITVENLLERPLTEARVVFQSFVYELGILPAHETKTFPLDRGTAIPLQQWVMQHSNEFQGVAQARHQALGDERRGHLDDLPLISMVASFSAQLPRPEHQRSFVAPPGLDLTALVDRGDAILLAWDANQGYAKPVNQFKPPRLQRNSLIRLAVPAELK
jgi:hypothetical protein